MESLRTLYRATVMLGTLVVGALAYRAYGPELEKLGPLCTRGVEIVRELWTPETTPETPLGETEPGTPLPEFTAQATPLPAPPLHAPPLIDQNVLPAGADEPNPPATPPAASPVVEVVRELNQRGVTDYAMTRWGDEGKLYRFHCSAACGESGLLSRHFEAIAETPDAAAREVLQQVSDWQIASGVMPMVR